MRITSLFRRTALILLAALPLAAQTVPPDTAVGKVLTRWLAVFNSGDRAQMRAFLETHQPERLENFESFMGFREQTGGFHLFSIEKDEPLEIAAIVHEREGDGNYARLTMKISNGEPAQITSLGIRVIPPPAKAPVTDRLPAGEAAAAWKAQITKLAAADSFSGVWIWAKRGEILASGAIGLANRERQIANAPDTQFRIGSMNKMFTAVATLQLVQKGKLSLDDTLAKHLSDYPNQDLASKVKVRHLLSHTGGTGDIFGPEFDKQRLSLRTLNDYVALYGKRSLRFEPGARWEYSNYGFLLLGVLIEKVTGQSYYDYVRSNIFEPAGMTSTASLPETETVAKRSTGYMKSTRKWTPNTDTLPWRGTSAGGGYSTASDLVKFAQALLSHKILSAGLLAEATQPQAKDSAYGFGFQTSNRGGLRSFGHGGGAPGMNGDLQIYPDSGQVIVVLANLDPPAASRAANWFAARMPSR